MYGFERDVARIRKIRDAGTLSDSEIARRAGLGSHNTVAKAARGNVRVETLRLILDAVGSKAERDPPSPLTRPISVTILGVKSITRKMRIPRDLLLAMDSDFLRILEARPHDGKIDGLARHSVRLETQSAEDADFEAWQVTPAIDGGTDFSGAKLRETPDPDIRQDFINDIADVAAGGLPRIDLVWRRRTRFFGDHGIVDRLTIRYMLPYIGRDDILRVRVLTRPQKVRPTLALIGNVGFCRP